jgi:hypothetical protein
MLSSATSVKKKSKFEEDLVAGKREKGRGKSRKDLYFVIARDEKRVRTNLLMKIHFMCSSVHMKCMHCAA